MKKDKNTNYKFIIGLFFMVVFACTENRGEIQSVLKNAESVMNDHPDSALHLLSAIENPRSLKEPLYYEYITRLVQAKNKNQIDISQDTIIQDAANYFIKTDNQHLAATALFYWGRLNFCKEQYRIAIQALLKAEDLAKNMNDYYLLGLINDDIASIHSEQFNYEKCLEYYYSAKNYFSKAKKKQQEGIITSSIGTIYLFMEPQQVDKAITLYQESLDFAMEENDTLQIISCLNNLAVAYSEKKDFATAKKHALKSIELDINNELKTKQYLTLSDIYQAANQTDSALILLNSLLKNTDDLSKYELYSCYDNLYHLYADIGDYKTAIEYQDLVTEMYTEILDDSKNESILEIEAKYTYEKTENLYKQTVIEKQKNDLIFSFITIASLILIIILFALYRRNRNKRRKIEDDMEAMESLLENEKETSDALLSNASKANKLLKKRLVDDLNIAKKIAYIHATSKDDDKKSREYEKLFHQKTEDVLAWENIYQLMDDLFPGVRKRLDEKMPNLQEKEKQMCYLLIAQFQNTEIAYILNYNNPSSVISTKCKLRKKLGFDTASEFQDFLNSLSDNPPTHPHED